MGVRLSLATLLLTISVSAQMRVTVTGDAMSAVLSPQAGRLTSAA